MAFSTALTNAGTLGPYNTDITLKYSKVLTNVGNAYNPVTGRYTSGPLSSHGHNNLHDTVVTIPILTLTLQVYSQHQSKGSTTSSSRCLVTTHAL